MKFKHASNFTLAKPQTVKRQVRIQAPETVREPLVVYALGIFFILSPVLSFMMSFYNYGIVEWYNPAVWFQYLPQVYTLSWVCMGLSFLAGVSLLFKRKLAWIFATLVLGFIVVYNVMTAPYVGSQIPYSDTISILSSVGIMIVLFFFRFPYLDRRDRISSLGHRIKVDTDTKILGYEDKATIVNISVTGALIHWHCQHSYPKIDEIIECDISEDLFLPAKVVRNCHQKMETGVEFVNLTPRAEKELAKFIKKYKK